MRLTENSTYALEVIMTHHLPADGINQLKFLTMAELQREEVFDVLEEFLDFCFHIKSLKI